MRSTIQIHHLRFSGEEKLHRAVRREIVSDLQKDLDRWPWSRTRLYGPSVAGLNIRPTRKLSEIQEFVRLVRWAFGPAGLRYSLLAIFRMVTATENSKSCSEEQGLRSRLLRSGYPTGIMAGVTVGRIGHSIWLILTTITFGTVFR